MHRITLHIVYLIFIGFFLPNFNLHGHDIILSDQFTSEVLNQKITLFEWNKNGDEFQKMINDELQLIANSSIYNEAEQNFSKNNYWFKLDLVNLSRKNDNYILQIKHHTVGKIRYFLAENDGLYRSSYKHMVELPNRHFALDLKMGYRDSLSLIVLLWSNGDPLASKITVMAEKLFFEKSAEDAYINGFFFSFFLIVLLISGITWFFLREAYVIYYALHLICLGGFLFSFEGFTHYFLGTDIQFVKEYEQILFAIGIGIFFILFVLSFFGIDRHHKKMYRNNKILIIVFLSIFLISLAVEKLGISFGTISTFVSLLLIWVISISLFLYTLKLKKEFQAKDFWFYFAAFALEAVGLSFHLWAYYGILPSIWFDLKIIHLTSFTEIIIFTYFIVDKIISVNQSRSKLALEMATQKERAFKNILKGEENERQRISKELHDGLGLILSTIQTRMSHIAHEENNEEIKSEFQSISDHIGDACTEVRTTSHLLASHILHRSGFIAALENDLSKQKQNFPDVNIRFNSGVKEIQLSNFDKIILFKICQELLQKILAIHTVKKVAIGVFEEDEKVHLNYRIEGFGRMNIRTMKIKSILARINILRGNMDLLERSDQSLLILIDIPVSSEVDSDEVVFESKAN